MAAKKKAKKRSAKTASKAEPQAPPQDDKPPSGLTAREVLFCHYYLNCYNGAKAARQAGYEPTSADRQAWELLRIPKIQAHIQKQLDNIKKNLAITAEQVAARLAKIAFSSADDLVEGINEDGSVEYKDFDEMNKEVISSVVEHRGMFGNTVEIKTLNRIEALKALQKYFDAQKGEGPGVLLLGDIKDIRKIKTAQGVHSAYQKLRGGK